MTAFTPLTQERPSSNYGLEARASNFTSSTTVRPQRHLKPSNTRGSFIRPKQRMNEIFHVRKEISDLTNILSLITKRVPDFEASDNGGRISEPPPSDDSAIHPETAWEIVDEAEFEAPVATGNAELDAIKRATLDRLAEVLARFKTAKGPRVREKGHSDAKHVTSVVMVEDLKDESVTFLCAKNEGLDAVDMAFLAKLEDLLRDIGANGVENAQKEGHIDQVFDAIFDHQEPRVKYYSTVLRDIIEEAGQTIARPETLTNSNVGDSLHQDKFRDWEDNNGFHFRLRLGGIGDGCVSDKAMDCLSDQEEETLVQEVCSEIRHIFGNTVEQVSQIPTKNLLKNVYRIIRHPRQRPALKSLLRLEVHNRERLFEKAWASLLYLTRTFFAAVTFVDLATRLNSTTIKFLQVPAAIAFTPRNSNQRHPAEVLVSLGYSRLSTGWRDFFHTAERVRQFTALSRSKRVVHGEVQLILHVHGLIHTREKLACKVFPYIGCSKKCCLFCDLFRIGHGIFQARGTHQTLFALWGLPQILQKQSVQSLSQFSKLLRGMLQRLLAMPGPPRGRDLLQQSSAALSTAQAVQREVPTYPITPQTLGRLMLGPGGVSATEYQIEFIPSLDIPGYANLIGGPGKQKEAPVPIDEAEILKINHERGTYMLEKVHEMPPTRCLDRKLCRRCSGLAKSRCSACWTLYCSKACQRQSWASHVFRCRVSNRPNNVDFLRLTIRRVTAEINSGDQERFNHAMLYLLADDGICSTFGFNNCGNTPEILELVCLYSTMLSPVRPAVRALQDSLDSGDLGNFMEEFCQVERCVAQVTNTNECACVTWFLERRASSESFLIPDKSKTIYEIWVVAVASAMETLDLTHKFENGCNLNKSQSDVFDLYVAIQPTFWLVPDIYSSSWTKFGVCYCRTFRQREELARCYAALAFSAATFDDIVSAYETASLAGLMRTHDIDISELGNQGIRLHTPPPCEYSIYRLMIGVEHALSGRFCSCFSVREGRRCHALFETHIDRESDANFGFHLTTSWERWQLLNFYKHLFRLPGFEPRCMAEATEDPNLGSLENYLDTLVPDMRSKISDRNRTNLLFPRLKDRLKGTNLDGQSIPHFHFPCECKVHDVVGPPGIFRRRVAAKAGEAVGNTRTRDSLESVSADLLVSANRCIPVERASQ